MSFNNKYRPQNYIDVAGQTHIVTVLRNSVLKNKIFNAYLFVGPHGSGKTTLVRIFSKSIHCLNPQNGEFCDSCDSCKSYNSGNNPNYLELDSASHGSIEDARYFKELSKYKVCGSKKPRIIVLDESHLLSFQSQNAFLKLLESKNNNVIIIFATTEYEKIIPQLSSRCLELFIRIPSVQSVSSRLSKILDSENVRYEIEALEMIASNSNCHIRNAVNTVEQITLCEKDVLIDTTFKFLNFDIKQNYYYALFNIKDNINESIKLLDNCFERESAQTIQKNIFNILVKSYQKFLGSQCKYDFELEKKLIDSIIQVYGGELIKLINIFKQKCVSREDVLFNIFQCKNKIEFKTSLENSIEIDQLVLQELKEKDWFKNKQGDMWLKSNNKIRKNTIVEEKVVQQNSSVIEDILPMSDEEFFKKLSNDIEA